METYHNKRATPASRPFRVTADRPLALIGKCPVHAPTAIVDCPALAVSLGIASLRVKNETGRMGLGSFKALGGAFAVAQLLREKATAVLGRIVDPDELTGDVVGKIAGKQTFITASAGNHGLSIAAGAKVFGARAVIVLPKSAPEAFAGHIRAIGADVIRFDGSYEDSVAAAIDLADKNDWQLLADGSWPGYVEAPALVMEGYTVLAEECRAEFEAGGDWPSHVFLQAGVGGLAASVAAHIRETWPNQPLVIIVEPDAAPCLCRSVRAGEMTRADGPVSNMGRLDCKDASLIAFQSLRHDADIFTTVTDEQAGAAAKTLTDHGIATTPSGAAGFAALSTHDSCREFSLGTGSRCLVVVSEGPE